MSQDTARTARELQMLETMVDVAHGLGLRFGEAANAEPDLKRSLKLLDAFHKCFQALRLGIRLCQSLRAPPKPAAERPETETDAERLDTERDAPDPAERDPSDAFEYERERDHEPVSLPKFLATLGLVARKAEDLADHLPAEVRTTVLPQLKGLLAQAAADPRPAKPTTGITALTRPSPQPAAKHALLGSTATPQPRPGPRPRPPWSSSG